MSLINQMLKDLDTRRSEVTGTDVYGHQIRAVPERPRIHVAWWLTSVLGVLLASVLAWVLLRPAPVAVPAETHLRAQLPLKLDSHLSAEQLPLQQGDSGPEQSAAVAIAGTPTTQLSRQTEAVPTPGTEPNHPRPADSATATEDVTVDKPAPAEKPVTPAPVAKAVPSAKSAAATPAVKSPGTAAPIAINKKVNELTPQQRAENEYRNAVLLVQQGRATEAVSELEQALQLDPYHAAARQVLVGVLLENKHQDGAVRKAREGLTLNPAQPALAMILARLQLEKGELRPAIETLQRTLPYAADKADYQSFVAALLQRDGRNKEAVEHYLLALQKAPQNGVWWMGLGISLQEENRLADAQEAFSRAKASDTLSPELLAFVESKIRQLQR